MSGVALNLANASAAGTTAGAPAPMSLAAPTAPPGTPPVAPPPTTGPPQRGPVAPHAGARSIGTHQSRSPNKRANPPHGMFKAK
jgi:hypothetical protein